MFIGHLPAGYLIADALSKRCELPRRALMLSAMAGAIAPDFDLLYFYLLDHRQHHHHLYPSHLPVVWLVMLGLAWLVYRLASRQRWALLLLVFSINGLVHLLLDSIVGDIWWLGPWVDRPFSLFRVRAIYQPWWLNFILNASFLLELVLVLAGLYAHRCHARPGSAR